MPTVRQLMIDSTGKAGEYQGEEGGCWLLRPLGGGKEWEVPMGAARRATAEEERRLRPSLDTDEPEYDFEKTVQ
ncbi:MULTISPECIES: hypothetical protein [Streptomyces]|uniref:Uncharacterized protein n=1 Tax=Streptomyces viridochromogenes TaxID=1938 RepID=A0A0L8JRC2_STRVR|nr:MULTISPECIES: hypothetical protein [Streptomyces]KOG16221.1 hypothetical protein ADK34_26155 [Streptomyces viridochromogenes]